MDISTSSYSSGDVGWLSRAAVHLPLLLLALARDIDASHCSEEEATGCKAAVHSDTLGELAGGGECQAKSYVSFTHLCTINNYAPPPTTPYCCCAYSSRILCCKYRQKWADFRCIEADDSIEIINDKLPQELLLTAILVPIAAALCCVVCCVRCICCRDDEDDTPCACSKCKIRCSNIDSGHEKRFTFGRSRRYQDVQKALKTTTTGATLEKSSLSKPKAEEYRDMMTSPLPNGGVTSSTVPSAPPLPDAPYSQLLSPTQRPSSTVGVPGTDSAPNTSYILHYVPLSAANRPSASGVIECTYQEIRPQPSSASTSLPAYQKYDARFPGNNCYGNANQQQTLIGILTNEEGRAILSDASEPREPPPTYEDANSELLKDSCPEVGGGDKEC